LAGSRIGKRLAQQRDREQRGRGELERAQVRRRIHAGEQQRQREEGIEQRLEFEEGEELQVEVAARAPFAAQLHVPAFFGLADDAFGQMPSQAQAVDGEHRRDEHAARQVARRECRVEHAEEGEIHRPADVDVAEVVMAHAQEPQPEHRRGDQERSEQQQHPGIPDHAYDARARTSRGLKIR
jgi:hypothetical protein